MTSPLVSDVHGAARTVWALAFQIPAVLGTTRIETVPAPLRLLVTSLSSARRLNLSDPNVILNTSLLPSSVTALQTIFKDASEENLQGSLRWAIDTFSSRAYPSLKAMATQAIGRNEELRLPNLRTTPEALPCNGCSREQLLSATVFRQKHKSATLQRQSNTPRFSPQARTMLYDVPQLLALFTYFK